MRRATTVDLAVCALAAMTGCGSSQLPRVNGVDPAQHVESGRLEPERTRLLPSVCRGMNVKPEYEALDEHSFVDFLKSQGLPVRTERARADLFYVEVQADPETNAWVRLRVATLGSAMQAGRELHVAILQHGKGSWGVHRSNLAVLGPAGSLENVVAFAVKTKLSCWGVLTVAGRNDGFVIPGNYREL